MNGNGLVDDTGAYLGLICSAFFLPWAAKHDQPRLRRTAEILRRDGFDGARIGNGFAGESWADRMNHAADVDSISRATDILFDEYQQRPWIILFADGKYAPGAETAAQRQVITRDFCRVMKGREHKILSVEPVNERPKGEKLDYQETRDIAAEIKRELGVLVTLSAPDAADGPNDAARLYDGSVADYVNLHPEREITGTGGRWEPPQKVDERWYDRLAQWIGEPPGPGSSGQPDFDPLRLVMTAWLAWLLRNGVYCFHPGAGIRGGGAWDRTDPRGRGGRDAWWPLPEWLDETPHWQTIVHGFAAAKRVLPPDVVNWPNVRGHNDANPINAISYRTKLPPHIAQEVGREYDNGPFDDARSYGGPSQALFKTWAVRPAGGGRFFYPALGLKRTLPFAPRHERLLLERVDPIGGDVVAAATCDPDEPLLMDPRPRPDAWNFDGDGVILRCTAI